MNLTRTYILCINPQIIEIITYQFEMVKTSIIMSTIYRNFKLKMEKWYAHLFR